MNRTVPLVLALLATVACGPKYLANTQVEDTPKNRIISCSAGGRPLTSV